MELYQYFIVVVNSILVALISIIAWKVYIHLKRMRCVQNFSEYLSVLEYHMVRAYEMIHKDRIFTYSLEGMRVKEKDIDVISQDFVRLVIKLIGPTLYKEFIYLYGDTDTFVFNILEYFNTRYEDDEIRKQSLDSLTEQEDVTEGL